MDLIWFQDAGYITEYSEARKKQTPMNNVRHNLKQEVHHQNYLITIFSQMTQLSISILWQILQLEKRLEDQFKVRCTLEKALGYRPISLVNPNDMTIPKVKISSINFNNLFVLVMKPFFLSKLNLLRLVNKCAFSSDTVTFN
jgi:hypothetical protein